VVIAQTTSREIQFVRTSAERLAHQKVPRCAIPKPITVLYVKDD